MKSYDFSIVSHLNQPCYISNMTCFSSHWGFVAPPSDHFDHMNSKLVSIRNVQPYPQQKHKKQEQCMCLDHTGKCLTTVALLPCVHSVFWDLYCAAPDRRETCEHSSEAKAFHDYVSELNQPSGCVRGAQIYTQQPLGCTRSHMVMSWERAQSVDQRNCSDCDNAAGSCFDTFLAVCVSAVSAAAPALDGTDSESDSWSRLLLKMHQPWTPVIYFMGKPSDCHLWIFKVLQRSSWHSASFHIFHLDQLSHISDTMLSSSAAGCTSSRADLRPLGA